jgi:hypothetical protein
MDEYELQYGTRPECIWCDTESYEDTDVVCLFDTLDEARAFRDEYRPACRILSVDTDGLPIVHVSEGYPAVLRTISNDRLVIIEDA